VRNVASYAAMMEGDVSGCTASGVERPIRPYGNIDIGLSNDGDFHFFAE
jgi:hypothetical protein